MKVIHPVELGISIYLNDFFDDHKLVGDYLNQAAQMGYKNVFTSIHLPEDSFQCISEQLENLSLLISALHLQLIVDCSHYEVYKMKNNYKLREQIRKAGISFFRLDFGFDLIDIRYLIEEVNASGLMLNTSMLNRSEVSSLLHEIKKIDNQVKLSSCHNFYPRIETGLSLDYFLEQSALFKELGILVNAFLPSWNKPRGPVYQGLPTIERHRFVEIGWAARELIATELVDGIIIGDPFASLSDLIALKASSTSRMLILRVKEEPDITETERAILYNTPHQSRPDISAQVIRSDTSREMAAVGRKIKAKYSRDRKPFSITIDNEKYGRYSGEMQITRQFLPEDERVNVVGAILPEDIVLLDYIQKGIPFQLQKYEKIPS